MERITSNIKPRHEYAWIPQEGPQTHAFLCPYQELFVGGSRGGGKTQYTVIGSFLKNIHIGRGWDSAVFRRKGPEHETAILKTHEIYPYLEGCRGSWSETKKLWRFENGATQRFRHLERDSDALNYKGQEYPHIAFEEADAFADWEPVEKIFMCCRSGNPEIAKAKQIILNANPGGPGHNWLKARFIDYNPKGYTPIVDTYGNVRMFIPFSIFDNKILMDNDPSYLQKLEAIKDPALKAAWLHGEWDAVVGGYFSIAWSKNKHKIMLRQFKIPSSWPVYGSYDWGSARPFSYGMYTVSPGEEVNGQWIPRGALIRFDERYGVASDPDTGRILPNKGVSLDDEEISREILRKEGRYRSQIVERVADPSIWSRDGGKSKAVRMKKAGVKFKRGKNDRKTGWALILHLLNGNEDGIPLFYVTANCTQFLRTFPGLVRDEKDWDDINTDQEDHIADEFRYMAMHKFKSLAGDIKKKSIGPRSFERFSI